MSTSEPNLQSTAHMPPQTTTFSHPALGVFQGLIPHSAPSVVQLRSVPFARIPARFRQSVLVTELSDSERDCTEYGAVCPQFLEGYEMSGGPFPGQKSMVLDEFKCLNLTISIPRDGVVKKGRMGWPVMVYVHGGGFVTGRGNVSSLHDNSRMVELSIQDGNPVVILNIHYRLNVFGMIASQDLLDECMSNGEPAMNFGLHDQRTAFKWVKSYISGFGGDPTNVTAFGESAGSLSLAYHISSGVPIFNRVVLMSGNTSSSCPQSLDVGEVHYQGILAHLGINEPDASSRLSKLREVPVEKLLECVIVLQMFPMWAWADKEFFTNGLPGHGTEADLMEKCDWVDSIIIGDCFLEGFVFNSFIQQMIVQDFISTFSAGVGDVAAKKILEAYEITPGMSQGLFLHRVMVLIGDLGFNATNHTLIRSLAAANNMRNKHTKKLYRYTITARNPFPGNHFQVPGHHAIDIMLIFMTLSERFPTQHYIDMSVDFGRALTRFGAGLEPWDEFRVGDNEEEKIAVVDGREGWVVRTRKQDERVSGLDECGKRRYAQWELLADALMEAMASGKNIRDNLNFKAIVPNPKK